MNIENCTFLNNTAIYWGGAVYGGSCDSTIYNTTFIQNNAIDNDIGSFGGALYHEGRSIYIKNSTFQKNHAETHGDAVYIYQPYDLRVYNSTFKDNGNAIYSLYEEEFCFIEDNDYSNDTVSINNTDYETIVVENGIKLKLINNTINYTDLPEKFDARDYGWVSPIKNQGEMGSCWAFGTISSLESALLKATGIKYNLSENNLKNSMLRYSKYGSYTMFEGGFVENAVRYFTSWLGGFSSEYDEYDEYGKLSPLIDTDENIHIQDVIIIPPITTLTYQNEEIKETIIKCGSIAAPIEAHMNDRDCYDTSQATYYSQDQLNNSYHIITVIGWDDNFPKENFSTTPEGNGAWICKNSWGTDWGKDGFFYISYYDKTIFRKEYSIGFIIEKTEDYTKNYQTEVGGTVVQEQFEYDKYYNRYTSFADDLIAGVGTYINEI